MKGGGGKEPPTLPRIFWQGGCIILPRGKKLAASKVAGGEKRHDDANGEKKGKKKRRSRDLVNFAGRGGGNSLDEAWEKRRSITGTLCQAKKKKGKSPVIPQHKRGGKVSGPPISIHCKKKGKKGRPRGEFVGERGGKKKRKGAQAFRPKGEGPGEKEKRGGKASFLFGKTTGGERGGMSSGGACRNL